MGKPQSTQLPNYQNYQNALKVKKTKVPKYFHFKKKKPRQKIKNKILNL